MKNRKERQKMKEDEPRQVFLKVCKGVEGLEWSVNGRITQQGWS